MLNIFDSNNYIRIQYQVDTTGLTLRNLYNQALYSPRCTSIFVFDGYNAKAARRAVFPGYKVGRPKAPDEFYKTLEIAKKVLRCTPQLSVEIEGFEADDVIGTIVKSAPPDLKITIHSNDGDFRTLCNENVKMSVPTLKEVNALDVRLYKTLVGDSSDKIPGFKRFGAESFKQLSLDQKTRWKMLLDEAADVKETGHEELGLTIKQMPWLILNLKDLQSYWKVVNFIDVPDYLMEKGTIVGIPNPVLANQYLTEILQ